MARLDAVLEALAHDPAKGHWPGLSIICSDHSPATTPVMLGPSLCLLVRGRKRVHLGERALEYEPGTCLLVTLPLPTLADVEVLGGDSLLGLSLEIDLAVISELIATIPDANRRSTTQPRDLSRRRPDSPIQLGVVDSAMEQSLTRFLVALRDPVERDVLGPGLLREVYFRMLRGAHADALRGLAGQEPGRHRMHALVRWLDENYRTPITVSDVAAQAGMSSATLHRHFRAVTGTSPMQYLKAVRLHRARGALLVGASVTDTAYAVGYGSATQFSREYRRLFGYAPNQTRRSG